MLASQHAAYDTAIRYYDQSIEYKVNYTNAHYNKGIALLNSGRYQAASEEFENAIRYGGQRPPFYKLLGASLLNLNRLPEAIKYLTFAAQNSNDPETYEFLAQAYQMQGNEDAARQMMEKARQLRGG